MNDTKHSTFNQKMPCIYLQKNAFEFGKLGNLWIDSNKMHYCLVFYKQEDPARELLLCKRFRPDAVTLKNYL